MPVDVALADSLAKRRAVTCLMLGLILFCAGAASIELPPGRLLPQLYSEAFYLWAATLLLVLVLVTGLLRPTALRAVLNDEATVQHRLRAMSFGFWAALVTSALFWLITEPITASEASRLIVTVALSSALFRFGWLEWRSLK